MFKKILNANRGEIAVAHPARLPRAGIRSVAVFSDVDRKSLHVRLADEAYPIGPAPSRESYLRIDKLMDVARCAVAMPFIQATVFWRKMRRCRAPVLTPVSTFIGPPAEAMESLGSKTAGRQLARRADVPPFPEPTSPSKTTRKHKPCASHGLPDSSEGRRRWWRQGHAPGQHGRRIRIRLRDASSEALNAFGDDRLYLEKYLDRPHHVEIQIFAERPRRVVSLGERECSVQRRHQK